MFYQKHIIKRKHNRNIELKQNIIQFEALINE